MSFGFRVVRKLVGQNTCGLQIILISVLIILACGNPSLEQNKRAATEWFQNDLHEADVNPDLFTGPTLEKNNETECVFRWVSTVPESGATIIDVVISKNAYSIGGFYRGRRSDPMYLASTARMPFDKAMLTTLFNLTSDTSDHSIFVKPLRDVTLTKTQLSDVASFIHIKRDLMEYNPCYKYGYPDSLEEFDHIINPDGCAIFPLDSMFTHDHWGNKYFYKNLGNSVMLGTPGKNRKWDFSDAVMDSVINFHLEQLYKTEDDIIVKFRPTP